MRTFGCFAAKHQKLAIAEPQVPGGKAAVRKVEPAAPSCFRRNKCQSRLRQHASGFRNFGLKPSKKLNVDATVCVSCCPEVIFLDLNAEGFVAESGRLRPSGAAS